MRLPAIIAAVAMLLMPVIVSGTAQAADMAAQSNRLTLQMMQAAIRNTPDRYDNVVLSPYNALTNLALVASGAAGQTREEMSQALFGLPGDKLGDASRDFTDMNADIVNASRGIVVLSTANGIWVNKDVATLNDGFADNARTQFGAVIDARDFAEPATVDAINDWAATSTHGLITKVVTSLSPQDSVVLASALYFKGDWTRKFDAALTQEKPFSGDGQRAYATPTMHQEFTEKGDLRFREQDDYEAVYLTYGAKLAPVLGVGGTQPSIRIVLLRPRDDSMTARAWLAAQDPEKAAAWLEPAQYKDATGIVELPHIDISQSRDLIPDLKSLGIERPFGTEADFSQLAESRAGRLALTGVSQAVVFKTNEEGSEAAAVTVTMAGGMAASVEQPLHVEVRFDRSFVFALQDIKTGTVLFMGAVNKPNKEMKTTN